MSGKYVGKLLFCIRLLGLRPSPSLLTIVQVTVATTLFTAVLDARMNTGIVVARVLTAAAGMGFLAWRLCLVTVAQPHTTVGTERSSVELVVSLNLGSAGFRHPHPGFHLQVGALLYRRARS